MKPCCFLVTSLVKLKLYKSNSLEAPAPSLGASEPLLHRMVKYLALASSTKIKDGKPNKTNSRLHLTYLLELALASATVCTQGLAEVLLGECTLYNTSCENGKDSFSIADLISQKIWLTAYLLKFDEMQRSNVFSSSLLSIQCWGVFDGGL